MIKKSNTKILVYNHIHHAAIWNFTIDDLREYALVIFQLEYPYWIQYGILDYPLREPGVILTS